MLSNRYFIYTYDTLKYLKCKSFLHKIERWRSTFIKINSFTVLFQDFEVKEIFSRTVTKLKVMERRMP